MTDTKQPPTTDIGKGLHLTINGDGLISLWDRAEQANETKEEEYLCLPLTMTQHGMIQRTIRNAKLARLGTVELQVGKPVNIEGYDEVASVASAEEDGDTFKVIHNNGSHILVVRQRTGGNPEWILEASFRYGDGSFTANYLAAMSLVFRAAGLAFEREK